MKITMSSRTVLATLGLTGMLITAQVFGWSHQKNGVARAQGRLPQISTGNFKFGHHPAIYYSNGQGHYCWYEHWEDFTRLTDGTWRDFPGTLKDYSMTYDGICTGGRSIPASHPDPDNS